MGREINGRLETLEDLVFDKDVAQPAATDILNVRILQQRL
jgi:hypothetical protein